MISTSSSLSVSTSVCQNSAAPTTIATFNNVCSGGGTTAQTVTVNWYYNTSGAVGTLVGSTLLSSSTLQSTTTNATVSYSITSGNPAYNSLMTTLGNYYIFCTITSPSSVTCSGDYEETVGVGNPLFSGSGSSGVRLITVNAPPTTSTNGGNQTLTACATTTTLTGNTPVTGTGTWTVSPVGPTITTPGSPTSGVSGLVPGTTYTFTWTIANSPCTASTSTMTVLAPTGPGCNVYCTPGAGVGCNPSYGSINNVTFNTFNNTTTATTAYENYTAQSSIFNIGSTYPISINATLEAGGGGCGSALTSTCITVFIDWNGDGDFADANETNVMPVTWTSPWTNTFTSNIVVPAGAVSGGIMRVVLNASGAGCGNPCVPTGTGQIEDYTILITACLMNTPTAGPDQNLAACANSATLAGNTITNGTGFWSLSSGVGTITTPSSPTSTVTNLGVGANTFYWTATPTDGNCPTLNDDVVITTNGLPTAPNAGPDAVTCNASYTLAGNTITVGTGAWSCTANCGGITFGAPTSPTSTVNGLVAGTPVTLTWTSTNGACVSTDNVVITRVAGVSAANAGADQAVCINTTATLAGNTPAIGTGTWTSTYGFISNPTLPNTEVTGLAATGVYTFTYTVSAVGCASSVDQMLLTVNPCDPTMNVVTCGTPMTFTDGGGNYPDNANIVTKYCPSTPGQYITATFSQMTMFSSLDNMIVLNGAFSTAPIIDDFYSLPTINGGANTITSSASDGCLTFVFVSNATNNAAGWTASISCTPTASTTNVVRCDYTDCLGGCMRTICGVPTQVPFSGGSIGVSEVNDNNNGCWSATSGEKCSNWFYINPTSSGTLAVGIYVNNGLDQDFLVWDGYAPTLSCPAVTGNDPLRCNFAAASSEGTGFDDVYDATYSSYESSIVISQAQIDAGYYLIMLVVSYGNSCPQATVDITFGGTATVGCSPPISPLGANILNFDGVHANGKNYIHWDVENETNLAYFTLEKSSNGNNWMPLGSVFAGKTVDDFNYSLVDESPLKPFTYYRLNVVDQDGTSKYSNIITISTGNLDDNWVSNLLPNPASDNFSFQYQGNNFNEPVVINMYNSLGQLIYTQSEDIKNKPGVTIDSSLLENGAYIVMITQGDKKMMKKLTIIR